MKAAEFSITLIAPGGAGKSTIVSLLAERFRIRSVDPDRLFAERAGNISEYINRFGYDTSGRQNVETYRLVLQADAVEVLAPSAIIESLELGQHAARTTTPACSPAIAATGS